LVWSFRGWFKNKVREALEELLREKNMDVDSLKSKVSLLRGMVDDLKKQVSEFKIATRVPVEAIIYNSQSFKWSLESALEIAKYELDLPKELLRTSLPSIAGTVKRDEPFETLVEDRVILIAGLKTDYDGKQGLFYMEIGGRRTRPFLIDRDTKEVVFLNHYVVKPGQYFYIVQKEGDGTLRFSLIGAEISRWMGL